MKETALRDVEFNEEELKAMRALQFMSTIPKLIVLNIGEKQLESDHANNLRSSINERYQSIPALTLCGKIEMEIAQLPSEEKGPFLEELGIDEPASNKLIKTCYQMLGLISFLTVGEDEVRAWTIRKGTDAVNAAGKVTFRHLTRVYPCGGCLLCRFHRLRQYARRKGKRAPEA